MSEIIDIIAKLSFELQGQGLEVAAQKLGEQMKLLSGLKAEERALVKEKTEAAKQDQRNQDAIRDAILRNQAAQKQLNAQLKESVTQNTKLVDAIKKETGYIGQLEAKISSLRIIRRNADREAVQGINDQIKALEKQRQQALGNGATGGLLKGLLPEGNIGQQLLQGALFGLGIGGGFGIITRLVSGLIDELKDIGSEMLNTAEYQSELRQKTDQLVSSIEGEVQALIKLGNQLEIVRNPETINQLQRELELIKAIGTVDGKEYENQKRQHDQQQKINQQTAADRKREVEDILKVQKAVLDAKNAIKQAGVGTPNQPINISPNVAGGILGTPSINQVPNLVGNYERIEKIFKQSGADPATLNKILLDIKKTGLSNIFSPQLTQALEKTLRDLGFQVVSANEKLSDASVKITADEVDFKGKLLEKEYELNRTLSIRLRGLRKDLSQQQLSDAEELSHKTIDGIIKRNELERNEELRKVDDEAELQAKQGVFSAKFGEQKALINKKYNDLIVKQGIEFNTAQIKQAVENAAQLNKVELEIAQKELQLQVDTGQDTLEVRQRIQQKQANDEIFNINKKYFALFEAARKNGEDTLKITEDYNYDIAEANRRSQHNALVELEKSYRDSINVILLGESRTENAINAGRDSVHDKERRILEERINSAQLQFDEANRNAERVSNDPNRTPEDLRKAKDEIDKSKIEIKKTKRDLINFDVEYALHIISTFASVVDSVSSSLNTIFELQSQKLDALIERQTSRVEAAKTLLDRGQTEAYQKEVKRLDELQRQRELNARKQIQINAILQASNAAVSLSEAIGAVIKIAAGGDPYTAAARVAAAAAAVIAAIVGIKTAFSQGFKEGQVDIQGSGTTTSDSIPARISRGESVITAKGTSKNKELLTMINRGYDVQSMIPRFAVATMTGSGNKNTPMSDKQVDKIVNAVNKKKTALGVNLDRYGVSVMVRDEMRKESYRFR